MEDGSDSDPATAAGFFKDDARNSAGGDEALLACFADPPDSLDDVADWGGGGALGVSGLRERRAAEAGRRDGADTTGMVPFDVALAALAELERDGRCSRFVSEDVDIRPRSARAIEDVGRAHSQPGGSIKGKERSRT